MLVLEVMTPSIAKPCADGNQRWPPIVAGMVNQESVKTREVPRNPREALENQASLSENAPLIAGQDLIDRRQAARLLGLRADDCQEADQA